MRRMDTASSATTISDEMAEEAESQDLLTLGIEEEYILVDPVEPRGVEAVEEVVAQVPEDLRGSVQHEYLRSQIEVASPPQLELADRIDARDLFMVKPLVDIAVPDNADDVFYWRSDYF